MSHPVPSLPFSSHASLPFPFHLPLSFSSSFFLSNPILSHPFFYCLSSPCPFPSFAVLFFTFLSYPFLSFPFLSCSILFFPPFPCHFLSFSHSLPFSSLYCPVPSLFTIFSCKYIFLQLVFYKSIS